MAVITGRNRGCFWVTLAELPLYILTYFIPSQLQLVTLWLVSHVDYCRSYVHVLQKLNVQDL